MTEHLLIKSPEALIEWLESYNWFDGAHLSNFSTGQPIPHYENSPPAVITFDLTYMSAGNFVAGTDKTLSGFRVRASGVSEFTASEPQVYDENYHIEGIEVDDECAKLKMHMADNIWLTCDQLDIVRKPDRVSKISPWLSDSEVSFAVSGMSKPTPEWWIQRFAQYGVDVAWRILGGAAVRPEDVPLNDYTGWFLLETEEIGKTNKGLMIRHTSESDDGFYMSMEWWHPHLTSQVKVWSALAKIVGSWEQCEVTCGNCSLTNKDWARIVADGDEHLASLYPGTERLSRYFPRIRPVDLDCMPTQAAIDAQVRHDFEALLRFYSAEAGGRQTNFVPQQLYKPDLCYKGFPDEYFMIWPTFLTDNEVPFEREHLVDISQPIKALMTIVSDDLRTAVHQKRIAPGVEFYLREGRRIVAEGKVLNVLDLYS